MYGEKVKASRLFGETIEVPSNCVKSMMIKTKSPEKITEQSFQFLTGGFRRSPIRRIIDMSGHNNFRKNLEFSYKGEWFCNPIIKLLGDLGKQNIP